MGLLADAFSYGDSLKRKVGGLLADPVGTIELGINRLKEDNNNTLNLFANAYPMAGDKTVLNSPAQKARFQKQAADYAASVGMAGMTTAKHSPEQLATWARERAARDAAKAAKAEALRQADKEWANKAVSGYGSTGISQHFTPEQLEQIKMYRLSGDRFGAQAEGRAQAVNVLKNELQRLGVPIQHQSNIGGGNSIYANINGSTVRISDHDLPLTPERMHNQSLGLTGKWDKSVLVDDWNNKTLSDYLAEIGFKAP